MNAERFDELLESYSDGTIGEEGSRELLSAFESDAELKTRFLDELRLSHSLHGISFRNGGEGMVDEVLQSIIPGRTERDLSAAVLSELRPSRPKVISILPSVRVVVGIAAAIAIGAFVLLNFSKPDSTLATIAHQADATWIGEDQWALDDRVGTGRLKLESGVVRLDFAKGVRVTLEGPADFELLGPGETRLHSGNLTAHVPPEGIGFLVHTERAKVVDLGTTFGVSVGENGDTNVAVYEGEVEVTSLASREEKIIREGAQVNLTEGSGAITTTELRPRSFRGWPVLFGVVNTGGSIRFINAQPIQNPAEVTDADNVVIFPERFGARLKTEVTATIAEPGDYDSNQIRAGAVTIEAPGQRVNTYLVQYNPPHIDSVPNSDQKHFVGEVTFDRPILAIVADRDQLTASDSALGKKRFEYPSGISRGLEHDDALSLSTDRRTLRIDWLVMQALKRGMDQVRVIVEAGPIDPE